MKITERERNDRRRRRGPRRPRGRWRKTRRALRRIIATRLDYVGLGRRIIQVIKMDAPDGQDIGTVVDELRGDTVKALVHPDAGLLGKKL
jgi:hypothetical protein